jgi:tetratricopeptide (TPR) repeat protein
LSILLKALKQAETANVLKPGADRMGSGNAMDDPLELEPVATDLDGQNPGTAQAREWVEPPGLLFGSSGLTPAASARAPAFRLPHLSLVPLTALLATLIALGYGVYLYFELQPPVTATPTPTPAVAPSPALTPAPEPATSSAAVPPRAAAPVQRAPAEEMAAPRTALPQADAAPAMAATGANAQPERNLPRATPSTRNAAPSRSTLPMLQQDAQSTLLSQAYAAYQRGALNEAQRLYAQAAARGRSVDALLGLATIASAQNRETDAQRLYQEVLSLDPRNAAAQGALLDLLGNTDNQATESRLKTLIERDPSPQLYQTLGNLYASEGRWSDAQAAYFEAYRGAPGNADYAFNLAVSLDQLRQFPAALTYYEKALASTGIHRFDRAQAETRVQQLKSVR